MQNNKKDGELKNRPLGPYNLFVMDQFKKISGRLPFADMSRELSKKWRNMDDIQKRKWFDQAAQARNQYHQEKMRMKMETRSTMGKKPRSPYIFYTMEKRQQVTNEYPRLMPKQIMKLMARMWRELSSSEKGKYIKMAQLDKKRYVAEKGLTSKVRLNPRDRSSASRKNRKKKDKPVREPVPEKVSSFYLHPFRTSSGSDILSSDN